MTNENPLKSIQQLAGIHFHINKYQRGYRWGMREIHSLLDDVISFDGSQGPFYCLQPLVVAKLADNSYELIDGQQRCTTIYLILRYLLKTDFFQLKYETRGTKEGSNLFLLSLSQYEIPDLSEISDEEIEDNISKHWKDIFILKNIIDYSVDNFYFFKAYTIIIRWLKVHESEIELLKDNLLNKTKVIWYDEPNNQDSATNTFLNFNDGKISLDQAELVKGLYVLDFKQIADSTRRSYEENQFADEWNIIEHHLKLPSFWNFVNNERNNREVANKISLLLELEKGRSQKEEDLYFTYREYEKAFNSDKKPAWRTLSKLYNQLEEWFNNRETYHLIGAVVHLTNKTVHDVVNEYSGKSTKGDLLPFLRNILRREFYKDKTDIFKESYNPYLIKYGNRGITPILLLYNIAAAQLTDKYYKFPFDLFRNVTTWNIEHIYAKNSKGFEETEDLRDWLEEIELIMMENTGLKTKELLSLLANIQIDNLTHSNPIVKDVEIHLSERLNKDSLANLCFLDNITNIQVGNRTFRRKRDMILEIDRPLDQGAYVPIGSRLVFQKTFTPSQKLTMNYWNTADRDQYLDDIKGKINQFLKLDIND